MNCTFALAFCLWSLSRLCYRKMGISGAQKSCYAERADIRDAAEFIEQGTEKEKAAQRGGLRTLQRGSPRVLG